MNIKEFSETYGISKSVVRTYLERPDMQALWNWSHIKRRHMVINEPQVVYEKIRDIAQRRRYSRRKNSFLAKVG